MKLECCQLTKRQAHEYEHQGKKPNCAHHGHVSLAVAMRWVKEQTHRWVKAGWSVVVDIHHWKAVRGSMQLVEGVESGRAPGRKYKIEAKGAHGREVNVRATNYLPDWMLP